MYYTLCLLPPILHNPVSCGADGLLRDAHDAAHGLVVHAHLVEDEEEGWSIWLNRLKNCIFYAFFSSW